MYSTTCLYITPYVHLASYDRSLMSSLGSQCRHQYCWDCLASWKEILRRGNVAHAVSCRWHTSNLVPHPADAALHGGNVLRPEAVVNPRDDNEDPPLVIPPQPVEVPAQAPFMPPQLVEAPAQAPLVELQVEQEITRARPATHRSTPRPMKASRLRRQVLEHLIECKRQRAERLIARANSTRTT